jgi:hypothetical protein
VLDEKYYTKTKGGLLEAYGHIFGGNTKLYVYPSKRAGEDKIYTLDDVELPEKEAPLLVYAKLNNKLTQIENANLENLNIISDDVLEMIRSGEDGWEKYVPKKVAYAIKENCLFDYPCKPDSVPNKASV